MTTKNLAGQLHAAKLHIAVLEKENADLQKSWNDELTARSRDSRELKALKPEQLGKMSITALRLDDVTK